MRYARTGASKTGALGAGCGIWRGCQYGTQGLRAAEPVVIEKDGAEFGAAGPDREKRQDELAHEAQGHRMVGRRTRPGTWARTHMMSECGGPDLVVSWRINRLNHNGKSPGCAGVTVEV